MGLSDPQAKLTLHPPNLSKAQIFANGITLPFFTIFEQEEKPRPMGIKACRAQQLKHIDDEGGAAKALFRGGSGLQMHRMDQQP